MPVQIKICGLTTKEAVNAAVKNKVSFVGCSFAKNSPRNVVPHVAAEITSDVPISIPKVAVVVQTDPPLLKGIFEEFKPDYLQFDGDTAAEEMMAIKKQFDVKVIVNVRAKELKHFCTGVVSFNKVADLFLFDAPDVNSQFIDVAENTFNWALASNIKVEKPWILSGGLNRFNVRTAIRNSNAKIINASSTLEEQPGIKSVYLIDEFVRAARRSLYF